MKGSRPVRVLLADDHEIVREGIRELLSARPDVEVVASVGTGRSAVRLSHKMNPDVVVLDISMPDLNGIDATRQILAGPGGCRVLCLSMHTEKALIRAMLRAGASGYLVKNCAVRELADAIHAVAASQTYLSPTIAADVVPVTEVG